MATLADARRTLKEIWGYDDFRLRQADAIESVLEGRDTFLVMPTGGGKSICYQVPAVVLGGLTVVVSPLLSLMRDQTDALSANGVAAIAINSNLSQTEVDEAWDQLEAGEYRMLYLSPERLMMGDTLSRLSRLDVRLYAVDEVHCISQWGPDFRPEYRMLGQLKTRFPEIPVLALTATADPATRIDIVKQLGLLDATVIVAGFDRPNIHYRIVPKQDAVNKISHYVTGRPKDCGIIYCLSRKRTEMIADRLTAEGIKAKAYHAGLTPTVKDKIQRDFQNDSLQVVVATIAFGMGIDKPNVRYVIHADLPKSVEGYYQETGRAGRDGEPSEAILFYSLGDVISLKRFIAEVSDPKIREIETSKLDAMVELGETTSCRRRYLLTYFGDNIDEDCGNCDVCEAPPEATDQTDDVKLALLATYQTQQKYGANHLTEVLRGSHNRDIVSAGHDQVAVYGTGKHRTATAWQTVFRKLVHLGYLRPEITQNGALKLMPSSRAVLRDGARVMLATDTASVTSTMPAIKRDRTRSKPTFPAASPAVEKIFERLRAARKQLADDAGVPSFVVFHDETLRAIAEMQPTSIEELGQIKGVGPTKLGRYGPAMIKAIGGD